MIIITGIGRSGTSFTAKVLSDAGANLKGDWFDDKIRAGMEYQKVAEINNLLIQGSSSSLDEAISKLGLSEIKSELSGGVIIKDPRFVLTLDMWLSAGCNIEHIVYCARDYKEIFDSSLKTGVGGVGDVSNGVFIPTFNGAKVYFTYLERMFFKLAKDSGIPITIVNFPLSAESFSEFEKLAFLADKDKLRSSWEKLRRPKEIGSHAARVNVPDDDQRLRDAFVQLSQKEKEVAELKAMLARSAKVGDSLPRKLERTFRKKLVHPVRQGFYYCYRGRHYPKVFGNSIPKSGTHLLYQIFLNMGFKNKNAQIGGINYLMEQKEVEAKLNLVKKGEYLYGHMHFGEKFNNLLKKNNFSQVVLVRDPRDVVVSLAFYIPTKPEHEYFPYFNSLSQRERIIASIKGIPGVLEGIAETYQKYLPWLHEDNCLVVKFEDLVGNRGGGSDEKQLETLRKIPKHLGISFNESQLKEIASRSFNDKSVTFRKGQIADWVNWLDDEMLSILKENEDVFKQYGYSI